MISLCITSNITSDLLMYLRGKSRYLRIISRMVSGKNILSSSCVYPGQKGAIETKKQIVIGIKRQWRF
ncbi:MAG TPA: hypothetical protein VFJ51_05465 [Nitrososphaeraceae archaeon]|nr:hypothetical protein [Nitrososphaeraceae archaeon]